MSCVLCCCAFCSPPPPGSPGEGPGREGGVGRKGRAGTSSTLGAQDRWREGSRGHGGPRKRISQGDGVGGGADGCELSKALGDKEEVGARPLWPCPLPSSHVQSF